jgi:hypothetical protein
MKISFKEPDSSSPCGVKDRDRKIYIDNRYVGWVRYNEDYKRFPYTIDMIYTPIANGYVFKNLTAVREELIKSFKNKEGVTDA